MIGGVECGDLLTANTGGGTVFGYVTSSKFDSESNMYCYKLAHDGRNIATVMHNQITHVTMSCVGKHNLQLKINTMMAL